MSRLVDEIRSLFATTRTHKASVVESLSPTDIAWVVRFSDCYGVAVPYLDNETVSERFHSARLSTRVIIIDGAEHRCLLLTSRDETYRNEFAVLCADFIEPGTSGEKRRELLQNPLRWWERWTGLLGNVASSKTAHGVLGELLVLEKILLTGQDSYRWGGVEFASHDIETDTRSYEVKSTLKRYDSTVTISNQFQLEAGSKPLSLVFCRFEESLAGDCIDDVVERLVRRGMDKGYIDAVLRGLRLEPGTSARKRRFRLLEMREYEVTEWFPRITPGSFKDNKFPEHIVGITYTVDLTGVDYSSWMD